MSYPTSIELMSLPITWTVNIPPRSPAFTLGFMKTLADWACTESSGAGSTDMRLSMDSRIGESCRVFKIIQHGLSEGTDIRVTECQSATCIRRNPL